MQIFSKTPDFDFIGKRKIAVIGSTLLLVVSLASLVTQSLSFGLDFTGGTLIQLQYRESAELGPIRDALEKSGHDDAVVQHFGTTNDVMIRVAPKEGKSSADISTEIIALLRKAYDETQIESSVSGDQRCKIGAEATPVECHIQVERVEFVGPQVGEELTNEGGLAMLYALGLILIYVAFRFEYRFALGSIAALAHDVVIVLGFFSVLQLDFDLTVLAAVLAVIGYSLNDTIVVFDRIRENFRVMRKGSTLEVVNASLNQTLSRTMMTSVTTMLVLIALFIFGGELIHNFSVALIVGVVVGTYSSIYVASSAALALGVSKEDLMPVEKEGEEFDQMP